MGKYDYTDLELTRDGDLNIDGGDFRLVRNQEYLIQSIHNRLKTSDPDWFDNVISDIAGNLEDLMGLPNTRETAEKGATLIGNCLTRDGLIDSEDLYIQPTPINKDVIVFFVFLNIEHNGSPIGFEISFNLHSGLTIKDVKV